MYEWKEREVFFHEPYVYHCMGSKRMDANAIVASLKQNGLMSHNTIGRCNPYGPLDVEHRIWFSSKAKSSFDDFRTCGLEGTESVLVRIPVNTFLKFAEENNAEIRLDDQYFGDDADTGFIAKSSEFTIPPSKLLLTVKGKAKKLTNTKFHPVKRSFFEKMSPAIRDTLEKLYKYAKLPIEYNHRLMVAYCQCENGDCKYLRDYALGDDFDLSLVSSYLAENEKK